MEFVKPLKIDPTGRTTRLWSLIHPVRHSCLRLRALLNNKRLVHAIAALASAFVFCSNAIAQPSSKESFYRITFDDTPVGFEYVRLDEIEGTQPRAMACYRRTQLNLKRMGQDLTLRASLWTEQTSSGQLLNFTLQRQSGSGSLLERSGEFITQTGAYQIREIQSGTRREYDLRSEGILYSPIFSSWLPERALSTNGRSMTPVLFPETAGISNIIIERKLARRVRLDDRSYVDTTRIHFYPESDPTMSTTLLAAADFRVIRQEKVQLGGILAIDLSSAEAAISSVAVKSLDLDSQAIIPLDRLITASTTREQLVLELNVDKGFLGPIPSSTLQQVDAVDSQTVRLTLTHAARTGTQHKQFVQNTEALAATRWMPVNDPILQRFAAIGAGGESEPYLVCQRLAAFTHAKLNRSAFSTEIVPADQVAKSLRGDCTEHAVFLATLIRIRGIPARVASGLCYTSQQYGFSGHMWVEALIDGQWLPFDSTADLEGFETTRIKLADSEMPDTVTSGVSLFLPIMNLAGRAKVRVISAD